jgi:hypothetical protein
MGDRGPASPLVFAGSDEGVPHNNERIRKLGRSTL